MSKILELFGHSLDSKRDWKKIVADQKCPYTKSKCFKVRKSDPDVSIGTCTVSYGKDDSPLIICPKRLLAQNQVFLDCMHLLSLHEPGNEIHIIPEVNIPGGSVDFFLASCRKGKVVDFVGIEFQTLDTTGTVWPMRQQALKNLGLKVSGSAGKIKPFGMNWKMTAKTILVQLHHKVETFEHISKKIVLVIQDQFLEYIKKEFNFNHLTSPASIGESMHFHMYDFSTARTNHSFSLKSRLSTDAAGIAKSLDLQAETKVELAAIIKELEKKISAHTRLAIK